MKISFKAYLNESNYVEFQQYLQQIGMTFPELLKKLQMNGPTAKGGNADFYEIPGSEYGVRIERWGSNNLSTNLSTKLEPEFDPHKGENFGQPIANYGDNIQILRLQRGQPAGFPYGLKNNDSSAEQKGIETLKQKITQAAAMPVQAYEILFDQILRLNQKGYQIDPSKSGNLLIDFDSKRFNIVDISKQKNSDYKNNAGDVLVMLMNNFYFAKYLRSDAEMRVAAQMIIKKVESASLKSGLQIDRNGGVDYSYDLANSE